MTSALNVIALISGGKDSFFSILHCLANGHRIIALANLHPQIHEDEDIDSFMYQTVGHSVIPLYEEALGIPLYRQAIVGNAANSSRDYSAPSFPEVKDETEALVPLLNRVKSAHPEANAISTGAILSTYQRTRVESVALRLGLIPLSFLWQFPFLPPYMQCQLLRDMQAVGQDARIIKVAGGGLDESFLGANVADDKAIRRLVKSAERFGSAGDGSVLGEGGEFETLAVDGPHYLWKKSITIGHQQIESRDGGSAMLRVQKATLQEKIPSPAETAPSLRIPELLDDEFLDVFQALRRELLQNAPLSTTVLRRNYGASYRDNESKTVPALLDPDNQWSQLRVGNTLYVSNMVSDGSGISEQMQGIVRRLNTLLKNNNPELHTSSIVHTTLLLRSMADFSVVNPIYGSLFDEPNPPARLTVSCGDDIPEGFDVVLSIAIDLQPAAARSRSGLHVQSRSYWAPANIGPYSQAIAVDTKRTKLNNSRDHDQQDYEDRQSARLVHVAGQIPLIPASMNMVGRSEVEMILGTELVEDLDVFHLQTVLSLQHLWRIGRTMGVKWWTGAVAFLSSTSSEEEGRHRAIAAMRAWKLIHERLANNADEQSEASSDNEEVDIWDLQNGIKQQPSQQSADTPYRPTLPVFDDHTQDALRLGFPRCFAVQVQELPRGADIEWMSSGLTTTDIRFEQDSSTLTTNDKTFATNFVVVDQDSELDSVAASIPGNAHLMVFSAGLSIEKSPLDSRATLIPCKRIWQSDGKEVAALVIARYIP